MPDRQKIALAGKEFEIVSEEEAEKSEGVICMPWSTESYFDDDVKTVCFSCGQAIRHRPTAPKRPPKICIACAPDWVSATRH